MSFPCPKCQHRTNTVNTQPRRGGVRRYRRCSNPKCLNRFATMESEIDRNPIHVVNQRDKRRAKEAADG